MSPLPFPLDVAAAPRHPPRVRRLLPSLVLLLPACSASPAQIDIDVTAGQETDAFTVAPAITQVNITVTSLDGTIDSTVSAAPGQPFDFVDNFDDSEQVDIAVTGLAGTATVMGGQSLTGLLLSAIQGTLPIFAQRKEQWSRPPGGLAASHVNGVAGVVQDRYLLLTGGTNATGDTTSSAVNVDTYDILGLTGDATQDAAGTAFSPTAQNVVPIPASDNNTDSQVLVLSKDGGAIVYDYTMGSYSTSPALPTGLTAWSDVTGGAVLSDNAGDTFIVGGTRASGATTAVVDITVDDNGDVVATNYPLNFPREGAAAAYLAGIGLVVAGGNDTAPGVELLTPTGIGFVPLDFPVDNVRGAGAVIYGSAGMLLIGGVDPANDGMSGVTRQFALTTCVTSCMPTLLPMLTLPVPLTGVSAYQLATGRAIAVGNEVGGTGQTRSFIVDTTLTAPVEALLREPRSGASVVPAPNATLALFGGQHPDGTPALSVELFLP